MDNLGGMHEEGPGRDPARGEDDSRREGGRGKGLLPPNYSAEDLRVEPSVDRAGETGSSADLRARKRRVRKTAPAASSPSLSYVPARDIDFSPVLPRSENRRGEPVLTYFDRKVAKRDVLIALVLAVVATVSVALTYKGIGHSWDEALYLEPATKAAEWWTGLLFGDIHLVGEDAVTRHWGERLDSLDPLHPEVGPVPKTALGLGLMHLQSLVPTPMMAMRLPVAIAFGLTLALMFLMGVRTYGRWGGLAAVAAYWLMPRVFGHAHIAASETLLAFAVVLLVWAFLEGIQRWPVAILVALAFALAIDTKVTALLLPLPLLLWGHLYFRRDYANNMFAMLFLAPFFALAMWPWLWHDTAARFIGYLDFYRGHQSTAVFYMRSIWGYTYGPAAPWHYPFVIAGISMPEWVLVLGALGILRAVLQVADKPAPVLYLLVATLFVGLVALPNTPKYDGERLFFAALPFFALLVGGGLTGIVAFLPGVGHGDSVLRSVRGWVAAFLLLACCVWGGMEMVMTHPNELNYFNRIVGGGKGAYEAGFETSYWGEGLNEEVCRFLNETIKPGSKVKTLALNDLAFSNLQEWGMLNQGVNYSPEAPPYDYYVLQVRQGFFGRVERTLHGGGNAIKTFEHGGVPRIQVFRGDAFATAPLSARAAVAVSELLGAKRLATTSTVAADSQPTTAPVVAAATSATTELVVGSADVTTSRPDIRQTTATAATTTVTESQATSAATGTTATEARKP